MAQIIIDYDEYLELLDSKKQIENIKNDLAIRSSWRDIGGYVVELESKENNSGTLFEIIKNSYGKLIENCELFKLFIRKNEVGDEF